MKIESKNIPAWVKDFRYRALPGPQVTHVNPRPLIFPDRRVVVSWAPKSACTHVMAWFFLKNGCLEEVEAYHRSPHQYRNNIYYNSARYKRSAREFRTTNGAGYTLVKVTRDPIKRMASIFRHICRRPFLHADLIRELGIDANRNGISLKDFRRYLKGKNLVVPTAVNPHVCAQTHPVWNMSFDRIITLNIDETPFNGGLNAIEAELGLPETRFEEVQKFENVGAKHYAKDQKYEGPEPLEEHRFPFTPQERSFPKKQLEESMLLEEMAQEFHGVDFDLVSTKDTQRMLFRS